MLGHGTVTVTAQHIRTIPFSQSYEICSILVVLVVVMALLLLIMMMILSIKYLDN
jgi:hypothetical protein